MVLFAVSWSWASLYSTFLHEFVAQITPFLLRLLCICGWRAKNGNEKHWKHRSNGIQSAIQCSLLLPIWRHLPSQLSSLHMLPQMTFRTSWRKKSLCFLLYSCGYFSIIEMKLCVSFSFLLLLFREISILVSNACIQSINKNNSKFKQTEQKNHFN